LRRSQNAAQQQLCVACGLTWPYRTFTNKQMTNNSISGDLAQLSLPELQTRKNKLQGAIIGLAIVLVVALAVVLYVSINRKLYGLLATVPAMLLPLVLSVIGLNKISREIQARLSGQ
jgi:hypothetical protein